ncbi:MAG: hypothetical protein VW443_02395 [Pseudomonadales bacterium]
MSQLLNNNNHLAWATSNDAARQLRLPRVARPSRTRESGNVVWKMKSPKEVFAVEGRHADGGDVWIITVFWSDKLAWTLKTEIRDLGVSLAMVDKVRAKGAINLKHWNAHYRKNGEPGFTIDNFNPFSKQTSLAA